MVGSNWGVLFLVFFFFPRRWEDLQSAICGGIDFFFLLLYGRMIALQ